MLSSQMKEQINYTKALRDSLVELIEENKLIRQKAKDAYWAAQATTGRTNIPAEYRVYG